jgi:putative transposase
MKSLPVCRTIQINGKQHYLWRAVDQDGEVADVFLHAK